MDVAWLEFGSYRRGEEENMDFKENNMTQHYVEMEMNR